MSRYVSPAEHKTILPAKNNLTCGITTPRERSMELLKLEIDVAITKNFWGNPKKPWRPKTDPGKGFGHIAFGKMVE